LTGVVTAAAGFVDAAGAALADPASTKPPIPRDAAAVVAAMTFVMFMGLSSWAMSPSLATRPASPRHVMDL
jgi:hypothetical protein